jgi:hypothetical protein
MAQRIMSEGNAEMGGMSVIRWSEANQGQKVGGVRMSRGSELISNREADSGVRGSSGGRSGCLPR